VNTYEQDYVACVKVALANRDDLTAREIRVLEVEIAMIEDGSAGLTGPQTVDERLVRLRDHYP
jgi:hypothetical protein